MHQTILSLIACVLIRTHADEMAWMWQLYWASVYLTMFTLFLSTITSFNLQILSGISSSWMSVVHSAAVVHCIAWVVNRPDMRVSECVCVWRQRTDIR